MPIGFDRSVAHFAAYADPDRLVSTAWVDEHRGEEGLVIVESDEDVLLYATGHIPGAVTLDWHTELNDPVRRDYVDGERFAELMAERGITRDSTVVFYGDRSNWWAAYALWVFRLFGHVDVRLMDGGRDAWIAEGRELTRERPVVTPSSYPVVTRDDRVERAFRDEVLAEPRAALIDVRSAAEYSGERTTAPDYPEEGALRAGHIPGAHSIPWSRAVGDDGRFLPAADLARIYLEETGIDPAGPVIAYCRIGERSSLSWFVLQSLLGVRNTRNYDGSWSEWGSLVGAPIVVGSARDGGERA